MSGERDLGRLVDFLPAETVAAWLLIREIVPESAYLAGGTGITAHLAHRVSRDLDFFSTTELDLESILEAMGSVARVVVLRHGAGTLSTLFGSTKVEVLSTPHLPLLFPTHVIGGLRVADLADIQAMKLRAITDRGALRDYFDLMVLERNGLLVETGLPLFLAKFSKSRQRADADLYPVIMALGSLADVEDDPSLPASRAEIEKYWTVRQPSVIRHMDRYASGGGDEPAT